MYLRKHILEYWQVNITVTCPYPCLFNFIWWHHASGWVQLANATHPTDYGLWVNLYFFTICMYKYCFLPLLLVFVMTCCIKMHCSLPHNPCCCFSVHFCVFFSLCMCFFPAFVTFDVCVVFIAVHSSICGQTFHYGYFVCILYNILYKHWTGLLTQP